MVVDDEHILLVGDSHSCVDRRVDALVLFYQEEIAFRILSRLWLLFMPFTPSELPGSHLVGNWVNRLREES